MNKIDALTIAKLQEKFQKMIDEEFGLTDSNSTKIQVKLINRTTHEQDVYVSMPYNNYEEIATQKSLELDKKRLDIAMFNSNVANHDVKLCYCLLMDTERMIAEKQPK